MPDFPLSIRALVVAPGESEAVDYKSTFDPTNSADWCELLKDIIAIANTSGGGIVFGVSDDGEPAGTDLALVLGLDLAAFGDKVYSYTGTYFSQLHLQAATRAGHPVAVLQIGEATVPLIPTKPGTYAVSPSKQNSAFPKGILLVRHGPKSEPATTDDLAKIIQERIQRDRRALIGGLRRVVEAPFGSTVSVAVAPPGESPTPPHPLASPVGTSTGGPSSEPVLATGLQAATPIRITNDPSAPAFQLVDPDRSHPYRMLALLQATNSQLEPHGITVSQYDIKVVGIVHGVYENLQYHYKSQDGPHKYSPALADWLVANLKRDRMFLKVARAKLHRMKRTRTR